jgi:hypothetical protein
MSMTNDGAICEELRGINLGDDRLNKRSQQLITSLAVDPQLSINASCDGWAETHAAYQFFDNGKVIPAKLLEPHYTATLPRMRSHAVVLIPQDTTELDYTAHPPSDTKCLNYDQRFGFYEHVQLAITPEGLPLGVVGTESHDREPESLGHAHDRRTLPIEDKESCRWLRAYQNACGLQGLCPDTRVVSIADREGDIYDLYVEYRDHVGPRAELLIRAQQARHGGCTHSRQDSSARAGLAGSPPGRGGTTACWLPLSQAQALAQAHAASASPISLRDNAMRPESRTVRSPEGCLLMSVAATSSEDTISLAISCTHPSPAGRTKRELEGLTSRCGGEGNSWSARGQS